MLSTYEDGLVPNGLNLTEGLSGSVLSKEKKTATHIASDSGIVIVNLAKIIPQTAGWLMIIFCKIPCLLPRILVKLLGSWPLQFPILSSLHKTLRLPS